jgi:hypothetical protein
VGHGASLVGDVEQVAGVGVLGHQTQGPALPRAADQHRRVGAMQGDGLDQQGRLPVTMVPARLAADVRAIAQRAFALLEHGLGGYAPKPAPPRP